MLKKIFLLILVCFAFSGNILAKEIDSVKKEFSYKTCNYHEFNFVFLKVYDAYLCTNEKEYLKPGDIYGADFSLILRYNMNFDKEELSKSSIEEINRYYTISKKDEESYYQKLMSIFPNVTKGSEIEARYNKNGFVELYYNKKFTGKITDPKFSRIFLDIWLYKDNKYQKMIKDLFKNE